MTCRHVGDGIIVCSAPSTRYRRVMRCPSCRARRRFTTTFGGWYGDDLQCCGCGNEWSDGYRMARLRTPAAKERAISLARTRWANARPASEYRSAVDEFVAIYCSGGDQS